MNMKRTTVAIAHADRAGGAMDILNKWAVELEKYAEDLGYNVVDISGPDITYHRFTEIIQKMRPAVLFNFSLGTKDYLIGNDMRCFLTAGREDRLGICRQHSNLKAIQEVAVVSYSSHSASRLGRRAVEQGTPCYIGWSEDLAVVSDESDTVNIFKEALIPISHHILEGWTAGKVVEQAQGDILKTVKEYKKTEYISLPLFYDKRGLTLLGGSNWRLP